MTTQKTIGRFLSQTGGMKSVRIAMSACAALILITPATYAVPGDSAAQQLIESYFGAKYANDSVAKVSASILIPAVKQAIDTVLASGTTGLTPAQVAAAALMPDHTGAVRSDRNTSAAEVVAGSIAELSTYRNSFSSYTNFTVDVGQVAVSVLTVNGTNSKQDLSLSGQESAAKAAVATLSDLFSSGTSQALTGADTAIAQLITNNTQLTGLPKSGFLSLLGAAESGIYGARGKSPAAAVAAADAFAKGVAQGNQPPFSQGALAVALLSKVSSNTTVDEHVAYEIGLSITGSTQLAIQNGLIQIESSVSTKYPVSTIKVIQGLAATITPVDSTEANRVNFGNALVVDKIGNAVAVAGGLSFVDPYFAYKFTDGIFNTVYNYAPSRGTKGPAVLISDAPKIATEVGAVVASDGNELTQVANVFGTYIGAGKLPSSSGATYATDLISAAVKGNSYVFRAGADGKPSGGGKFGGGSNSFGLLSPTTTVSDDLASIVDVLANGIITANTANLSTSRGLATVAGYIGSLAKSVAAYTKNETIVGSQQTVAAFLAGTVAHFIVSLNLTGTEQTAILNTLTKDIQAETNSTVDKAVAAAVANYAQYTSVPAGPIATQETAITNL